MLKQFAFVGALLFAATASATLTHQYTFNDGTANDSVGGANGTLMGAATVSGGQVHLTGAPGTYVNLPGPTIAIKSYIDATFEGWFSYNNAAAIWQRLFDFGPAYGGSDPGYYLFYTPNSDAVFSGATTHNLAEMGQYNLTKSRADGGATLSTGVEHYVAVMFDSGFNGGSNLMSLYVDGSFRGSASLITSLSGMSNTNFFLGASNYPNDPKLNGSIDEFNIYDTALDAATIAAHYAAGPVPVPEPDALTLAALGLFVLLAIFSIRRVWLVGDTRSTGSATFN